MLLNLTVLGLLSGTILAVVYNVANPLILANKEKALKEAIFTVLPGSESYVELTREVKKGEPFSVYFGFDSEGEPTGAAFQADGNGFSGNVGVMVGLGPEYAKLRGIEILEQIETPGLGDRIEDPEFKEQFRGVEVSPDITYIKFVKPEKPNQIQAITGATISSKTVVDNINNAVDIVTEFFPRDEALATALEKKAAEPEPAPDGEGAGEGEEDDARDDEADDEAPGGDEDEMTEEAEDGR